MRIFGLRIHTTDLALYTLIAIMVLLVIVPVSPANMPVARRDSGVFLYTGWRLLEGDVPYLDVWDHKPPVIFLINAVGLLASNNSRWGIWSIEVISLLAAAILSFRLFQRAFDRASAILAVFIWLFTLVFMLQGGNFTTEYTLPLQFGCFWLFWNAESSHRFRRNGFLIGLLGSVMFFTQQVTVGILGSILVYILLSRMHARKWSELVVYLTSIAAGFIVVAAMIIAYFAIRDGLKEFWDAAFSYNFAYVARPTFYERMQSLYRGWLLLSTTNLHWFGILGWSLTLSRTIFGMHSVNRRHLPLLHLGLINLPIELGFSAVGGRLINHHFITLLPIFSFFSAFLFYIILRGIHSWLGGILQAKTNRVALLAFILALPLIYLKPIKDYLDIVLEYQSDPTKTSELVDYLVKHSSPDDTLLSLEAETFINFAAGRVSPSKYVYQYPLNLPTYTSEAMIVGFLQTLLENPPALIVDIKGGGISPEKYAIRTDQIDTLIGEVQEQYSLVHSIGPWQVYQHR
jgi:hypothetical protein